MLRPGARAFDLLLALIEARGRVLTKDELLDRVWPGAVVEEANIQVQVSALRKAIGPDAIATIPGRGYRFAALVYENAAGTPPPAVSDMRMPPVAFELNSLYGREVDESAVLGLVTHHRLVTILGPGGIGKTSLAEAVMRAVGKQWSRSDCYWIDLAPLQSAAQLRAAVARSVGISIESVDDARLANALAERRSLLVFDNCEHLAADTAEFAASILSKCPGIHMLATSQEPLRIGPEQVYRLGPLAMAPPGSTFEDALAFASMQLLKSRLQAAGGRPGIDATNVGSAIALCTALDGNALAIEMAAAWVPVVGLEGVGSRLAERLQFLTSARRDLPVRQRSLRAALEWSHGLLDDNERAVLRRASIFHGSFGLADICRVAAVDGFDGRVVVEALSGLVDKSLVQANEQDPPRYRLFESVRLFASEALRSAGEVETVRAAHLEACGAAAAHALADSWTTPEDDWLARHSGARSDFEAAFDEACKRKDAELGAAIVGLLCRLDDVRGVSVAVRERKRKVRALLDHATGDEAHARLWSCLTWHNALSIDEVPRRLAALEAVAAWRRANDQREVYLSLWRLAVDFAAGADAERAIATAAEARRMEEHRWPARLRWVGATAANDVSSLLDSSQSDRAGFLTTLSLAEEAGSERCSARTRLNFADRALAAGNLQEAIAVGASAIASLRRLGQPSSLGWALSNLCAAQLLAGDHGAAKDAAEEAFPLMWAHGWGVELLNHLALMAVHNGRLNDSAMLLGYVSATYTRHHDAPLVNESRLAHEALVRLRLAVGEDEVERLAEQGAQMSEADVLTLARSAFDRF